MDIWRMVFDAIYEVRCDGWLEGRVMVNTITQRAKVEAYMQDWGTDWETAFTNCLCDIPDCYPSAIEMKEAYARQREGQ